MWDLLRVYFGIALVARHDDDYKALTTLAVNAVTRYVVAMRKTGEAASLRTFEKFGEKFIREDSPEFLTDDSEIDQYLEILEQTVGTHRLSKDKDVNMIFKTVAEAVMRVVYRNDSGRETQQ